MKIIDKNGRLFGKISVIDVVVIAVVAALATALYMKNNTLEHTSTSVSNDVITYQVLVNGARTYVGDVIQCGDQLFDPERSTGGSLGTIVDIQRLEGTKLAEFNDGTVAMAPVEDGENILLTVEGSGMISNGRVLLNRIYDLGVNSSRTFCTKYAQFTATVIDIF
ncbi:MAG: DUF4330 domain-containing protein [Clostridium sp.]|nr:DUF4330 domain-containing protein [Clostridium sp.]